VNGLAIPVLSAVMIMSVTDVLSPFVDGASREGRKGNARYEAQDWDHALEHYRKAAAARQDGMYQYNLGAAAYRKKDYQTATQAFSRATADVKMDRDRAAYNLGNTRFKAGDLQGALGAYRTALCANPNDAEARLNYELTLRQLKSSPPDSSQKNQPQQQQNNPQNGQNQNQQNQSGQRQENKQDQSGQQNQNQGQQNQQNPQDQSGKEGQENESRDNGQNQPNPPQPGQESKADSTGGAPLKPGQMTPAEAKRLLNAVTPEERELLQARLKATRKHRAEKDW
jgi:Ca-activated chloride channel homolog